VHLPDGRERRLDERLGPVVDLRGGVDALTPAGQRAGGGGFGRGGGEEGRGGERDGERDGEHGGPQPGGVEHGASPRVG
jgi:hypothetical protein